jgi:hypothetical protein
MDDEAVLTGVSSFEKAQLGDEAYTWENGDGDWGEYRFETVDPKSTGAWGEYSDIDGPLIRKRWRLVEVVEFNPNQLEIPGVG